MIFLRAHYSIDLIAGVIFGHYLWIISGSISDYVESRVNVSNKKEL